jgi:hypothetical protein
VARACLFCERTPVTLEHVWPDWTTEVWVTAPSYTHEYRDGDQPPREWTARGPDVTVNAVDKGCNSGWMSDLESEAKTVLVPMTRGESVVLTESEQKILALWAVKTALMFKALEISSPTFNRAYYGNVYSELPDPPQRRSYVWLGRFDPDVISGHYHTRNLFPSDSGVAGEAHGFLSAFSLVQVVFQVGMWAGLSTGFEVESDYLVPLLPYREPIEWPLTNTFPIEAFPELTDGHFPEAS